MPEVQNTLVRSSKEGKKIKRQQYLKRYHAQNREKLKKQHRERYLQNRKAILQQCRQYRKDHPEENRKKNRDYYARHPEKRREKLRRYRAKYPERVREQARKWRAVNKEKCRQQRQRERLKLKVEIFNAYGGPICKCCGETMIEALSIDHIQNGRGNPAKRWGQRDSNLYRKLKRDNFPKGNYQVLCLQCNFLKGIYDSCPHKQIKTPIDLFLEKS